LEEYFSGECFKVYSFIILKEYIFFWEMALNLTYLEKYNTELENSSFQNEKHMARQIKF